MEYKHILIISLILLILSLTAVSAADFDDINVNESSGGDDSLKSNLEYINVEMLDDNTASGTFEDLQLEVNNASEGSVLNLTRDYKGHIYSTVYINKDLTIDGQGHIIDCLGKDMCIAFTSQKGEITLKNLKIINGYNDYDDNGGAIIIKGSSKCTIDNCTFLNNLADDSGGAIFYTSSEYLNIKNCLFKNNKVDYYYGGAICSVDGKGMIISNCEFEENYGYIGGAIYSNCLINMTGCSFKSNNASLIYEYSRGGAVFCDGEIIINNSTFINNTGVNGGSIYGQDITVNNCVFKNNIATHSGTIYAEGNLNVKQSSFISNEAYSGYGGAIYALSIVNAENVEFVGNKAYGGGAIDAYDLVNIMGCLFESNQANMSSENYCYGGAIYCEEGVEVKNSTFKDNYAKSYGGAIYAKYININNNLPTEAFNTFFTSNIIDFENGGALYATQFINAVNTVFYKNTAKIDGGAAYARTNINVRHCLFESNQATCTSILRLCYGGAMRAGVTAIIDNSTFKNNYADNKGGAVYADDITIKGNSSFFEGNAAKDYGGAIYTEKFNYDVRWASFTNNDAYTKDGGAIYINHDENWLIFSQCVFANNKADDNGGAIYIDKKSSYLILKNNIFISNSAGDEGQDVYTKGFYDKISENFWSTNPSEYNDQLIEWKPFPYSNIHHTDSNPLRMEIKLSENPCVANTSIDAAAAFYKNNGDSCSGALYTDFIEFLPVADVEFENRTNYANSANIIITPTKEGTYKISANLFGKTASETLEVMTPVKYMGFQKEQKKVKLTLKSVTVKKSAKKIVLTATLKKGKNPLKKKSIVFKFNGKTYKTLTSSKGIAKVTIQKNVLKKLKVGKKIQYQGGYGKLKVKKTAKVKK